METIKSFLLGLMVGIGFVSLFVWTRHRDMITEDVKHEYQLDVDMDSLYLYQNGRHVANVPFDSSLSRVLIDDNR